MDDELKKLRFVPGFLFPPGNVFLSLLKLKDDEEIIVERMKGASLIMPRKMCGRRHLIIYFHGGAFIYKAAPYHYRNVKEYVLRTGVMILMVDYSLSPRAKYPQPLEEAMAWYEKYAFLRPALAGDSAGGEIALSLTMRIIEKKLPLPSFLMLLYPVVAPIETESKKRFTSDPVWNSRLNEKMWRLYLGKVEYKNVFSFPFLSSFPPTYIETAELDALSDEGEMLYKSLSSSGVECEYHKTSGAPHGYDMIRKARVVEEAFKNRIEYIIKMFSSRDEQNK